MGKARLDIWRSFFARFFFRRASATFLVLICIAEILQGIYLPSKCWTTTYLQGQEEGDDLDAVEAPVDVVAHEQVVGVGNRASDLALRTLTFNCTTARSFWGFLKTFEKKFSRLSVVDFIFLMPRKGQRTSIKRMQRMRCFKHAKFCEFACTIR